MTLIEPQFKKILYLILFLLVVTHSSFGYSETTSSDVLLEDEKAPDSQESKFQFLFDLAEQLPQEARDASDEFLRIAIIEPDSVNSARSIRKFAHEKNITPVKLLAAIVDNTSNFRKPESLSQEKAIWHLMRIVGIAEPAVHIQSPPPNHHHCRSPYVECW